MKFFYSLFQTVIAAVARPAPNVIAKIVLAKVARSKFEENGKLLFCK